MLKSNLKACSTDPKVLNGGNGGKVIVCEASLQQFESDRGPNCRGKDANRAGGKPTSGGFTCVTCIVIVFSHRQTHPSWRLRCIIVIMGTRMYEHRELRRPWFLPLDHGSTLLRYLNTDRSHQPITNENRQWYMLNLWTGPLTCHSV